MEHLLEQVAWPGAQPPLVRPNEAAPLEPTSARVEPVPADPYSPMVNPPSSPELEVCHQLEKQLITLIPPGGGAADLSDSSSGEVVALSDSPVFPSDR
ncbi:hypothetical protein JHK82_022537 [Glycine max]|nr:hypothetical protein JHK85_023030 [Glycine max]KAG5026640.1 hypothetical protein JHK86_022554 [Glycine max]KAG5137806.1 hypothetical protein JHK82_022537 [Glycine max]